MGPPGQCMGPPRPLVAPLTHQHQHQHHHQHHQHQHHDPAAHGDVKPHNFLHSAREREARSSAGGASVTQNFLNVGGLGGGQAQGQGVGATASLDPIKRLAAMVDRQSGAGHAFGIGSNL